MKTRVITGVAIAVVLFAVLILGGWFLWGALLAVSLVACFELCRAMGAFRKSGVPVMFILSALGVIALYIGLKFTASLSVYIIVFMVTLVVQLFVYVLLFPRVNIRELNAAYFSLLYAPCMLTFVFLLREMPYGNYLVWVPFNAWICDTCAYLAGSAFGRHKMTPELSPKKTVEGAVGGTLGAVIAGIVFGLFLGLKSDNFNMVWIFTVITLLESIVTQVGDLAASGIKRDFGIKDYGGILPGHGGIMDRFDSVILASPIVFFLALWLVNPT